MMEDEFVRRRALVVRTGTSTRSSGLGDLPLLLMQLVRFTRLGASARRMVRSPRHHEEPELERADAAAVRDDHRELVAGVQRAQRCFRSEHDFRLGAEKRRIEEEPRPFAADRGGHRGKAAPVGPRTSSSSKSEKGFCVTSVKRSCSRIRRSVTFSVAVSSLSGSRHDFK